MIKRVFNKLERYYLKRKGYSSFSRIRLLNDENKNSVLPRDQKRWASKRGFFTYRILQYGLTDENWKSTLSDRDYAFLQPLNDRYRFWVLDKLTMKYVLAPFDRYMPRYFFHIMKDRGIMRLMDCPEQYTASPDGVLALIKEQGIVAAKPSDGAKGKGFLKLEADGSGVIVNNQAYSDEAFKDLLAQWEDYVVTEYVKMHPDIEKLNPCSVNTIRCTVINEHGDDPILPFAFMRVGTRRSGVVDNTSAGGMICKVDVATGRFYDGETLTDHVYKKAEYHPDTHEKMEGVLPQWDLVKTEVLRICKYMPDLEWLGFDVVITPDSFLILEINTAQDLHKAHEYPAAVNDYLFRKLHEKKVAYGIKQ